MILTVMTPPRYVRLSEPTKHRLGVYRWGVEVYGLQAVKQVGYGTSYRVVDTGKWDAALDALWALGVPIGG